MGDMDSWCQAEQTAVEILRRIRPTVASEVTRRAVIEYVQGLVQRNLGIEGFPFGSVPLRTYLPDGDIDLMAVGQRNCDGALATELCSILKIEEKRKDAEFKVKDVQYIHAEVKVVKCFIQNIAVDISFNQIGGLCTLCFLEQIGRCIGKDHLLKQSIMLIKAWCYYESRILGAHHALISTYALETLILYIFIHFHSSLNGPFAVLYKFLDYFSKFDWDNYCLSVHGPVSLCNLPEVVVEPADTDGGDLLFSKEYLKRCMDMFSVPTRGSENNTQAFPQKYLNIIDPLRGNNNLGRSVSKSSFHRIRSALEYGARKLGEILLLPQELVAVEVINYFMHTFDRHGSGKRLDVLLPFSYKTESPSNGTSWFVSRCWMPTSACLIGGPMVSGYNASVSDNPHLVECSMARNTGDETRIPAPSSLLDLTGDYDLHIRNLLYAKYGQKFLLDEFVSPDHQKSREMHVWQAIKCNTTQRGVACGLSFPPSCYRMNSASIFDAYQMEDIQKQQAIGTHLHNEDYGLYKDNHPVNMSRNMQSPSELPTVCSTDCLVMPPDLNLPEKQNNEPHSQNYVCEHLAMTTRNPSSPSKPPTSSNSDCMLVSLDENLQEKQHPEPAPQSDCCDKDKDPARRARNPQQSSSQLPSACNKTMPATNFPKTQCHGREPLIVKMPSNTDAFVSAPDGGLLFGSLGPFPLVPAPQEFRKGSESINPVRQKSGQTLRASSDHDRAMESYQLKDDHEFPPLSRVKRIFYR